MMRADRKKVEPLVKTARGQIEAVLKMIDDDRYCIDIINQLAATEALLPKGTQRGVKRTSQWLRAGCGGLCRSDRTGCKAGRNYCIAGQVNEQKNPKGCNGSCST